MSRIQTGQPVFQKGAKPAVKADPFKNSAHLGEVKKMDCIICGAPGPSDAHHCTHRPDHNGHNPYKREPCAGRRSADEDTIPLCKQHHQNGPEAIHNGKQSWRDKHGADYTYIPQVRARVAAALGVIDF